MTSNYMNKSITVLIVICILVILGVAAVLFWPRATMPVPNETPGLPVSGNSNTNGTVSIPVQNEGGGNSQLSAEQRAVQETYWAPFVTDGNNDNVRLGNTAVVEEWALQKWVGDETGGEALLRYDSVSKAWVVVDVGGGAWSVDALVRAGVPESVAGSLLSKLRQ